MKLAARPLRVLTAFLAVSMAAVLLTSASSDAAGPVIPKGKGDKCVADTDFMRRSHPDLLNHQRDDTVRRGMRKGKFSLRECVACHAVPGPKKIPVKFSDPKHFCRACHDYAAVRIDCFECHASRPDKAQWPLRATAKDAAAFAGKGRR